MNSDNYTPDYDEGMQLQSDQEEAYVVHTVNDINTIIQEVGVEIVMENLNDYSTEQIVKWLAKHY
jgi:PP-loop superfamily ATP-utilizing enzyme